MHVIKPTVADNLGVPLPDTAVIRKTGNTKWNVPATFGGTLHSPAAFSVKLAVTDSGDCLRVDAFPAAAGK